MRHIFALMVLLFTGFVQAEDIPFEMSGYLSQPLDTRVKLFLQAKTEGERYLAHVAFDPKMGLQQRWRAITTMGRMNPTRFQKELERALKSKDWFMRNAALIALQTASHDFAVQQSTALLSDPALVVRTQAVRNLIQLDARETEPRLWREIFSPRNFRGTESLWVRAHMAEALAKFTTPGRAKFFQRLLLEPDERLHKWAVIGLESTTGFKMTDRGEPVVIRRQKWLARLGMTDI